MSTKHTPGPWFAVNDGTEDEPMMMVKAARIAGRPPQHEVAIVATGDSSQEMEDANARLIASAPEMLDALVELNGVSCVFGQSSADKIAAAKGKAAAAIAKATGKSS